MEQKGEPLWVFVFGSSRTDNKSVEIMEWQILDIDHTLLIEPPFPTTNVARL